MVDNPMEPNKRISEEKLVKELNVAVMSVERLAKEQKAVSEEILQENKDGEFKKILTNHSAIVLTEQKHESGEGVSRVKKSVR